jgi:hypothetical protein
MHMKRIIGLKDVEVLLSNVNLEALPLSSPTCEK